MVAKSMSHKSSDVMCVMCGKIIPPEQIISEIIDDEKYFFDKSECILFFKKFKILHGSSFNVSK